MNGQEIGVDNSSKILSCNMQKSLKKQSYQNYMQVILDTITTILGRIKKFSKV